MPALPEHSPLRRPCMRPQLQRRSPSVLFRRDVMHGICSFNLVPTSYTAFRIYLTNVEPRLVYAGLGSNSDTSNERTSNAYHVKGKGRW